MVWCKEDSKYTYCESLEIIKKELILLKTSGYGCNSDIYIYKVKELLKVFNRASSIGNLLDLETVKSFKTSSIVKPIKFLFVNQQYYGYTMKKCDGKMVAFINPNTKIKDFLESFKNVENDLKLLSKNKFVHNDLNCLNVLYDNKSKTSSIIDCDSIVQYPNDSKELITIGVFIDLYSLILEVLSNIPSYKETNNEILKCMRNMIINKVDLNESIEEIFNNFILILENQIEKEITTINEFRKALVLSNK